MGHSSNHPSSDPPYITEKVAIKTKKSEVSMADAKNKDRWLIQKAVQKIDNIILDEWLKKAKRWSKKWHEAES